MLPRASLGYIKHLNWARLFSHRPAPALTTPLQDWSPPRLRLRLLLDAHSQMRRGHACCVSSKWPQASWLQVSIALLCLCHQEAQFLIASQPCPALSVPSRVTRPWSQVSIAISWIPSSSHWTVQLLYATSWFCHRELLYAISWYSHQQWLYATSWYCHQELLYATSWYSHEQLLYTTSWYCHQQLLYATSWYYHPQFLYATSWYCNQLKPWFCLPILPSQQRSLSSLQPSFKRKITTYFCMYVI